MSKPAPKGGGNPPPKKPREASDHYALECFKLIDQDKPVDLSEVCAVQAHFAMGCMALESLPIAALAGSSFCHLPSLHLPPSKTISRPSHPPCSLPSPSREQLSEERLRKVCRLVSAVKSPRFDREMDFKDLKTAARQLLQQPGNMIRFQNSVVQLEAKARWSEMDADAKAPYEAKAKADLVRWRQDLVRWRKWQEAESELTSASGSGGAGAASGGGADAKPPKEKKGGEAEGISKGGEGGGGGGGTNNLLLSKKERKEKAAERGGEGGSASKKPKKDKDARAEEENKALPGKKRKRFADDDDSSDDDKGGGGGGEAGKGSKEVERVACPELGEGWMCVSKKRLGGQGVKNVDKTYVSPDGKQFSSRKKVLEYLGMESDPLDAGKPKVKAPRALTHKERQKQRLAEGKARLSACLTRSQRAQERLALAESSDPLPYVPGSSPEPPGRLPLTDGSLATDVMPLWSFACAFSYVLAIFPVNVDVFCAHIQRQERSVYLAELHVRLLRSLLSNVQRLRDEHQVRSRPHVRASIPSARHPSLP